MRNIFLSRPNWVYPSNQEGLDNFINLLKSHDLSPRTIGATDFPSKSPMDEVIDLLYECEGAIVLGYPQIEVKTGFVKDHELTNSLNLSTEWNHIEAGLAYALGLPLLVIHDIKITRGIFDRGVLNSFLHQKNFSDKAWGISEDIIGAVTKWKSHLKPIKRPQQKKVTTETPVIKWGCFTFPPDPSLYCPFCYNKLGEKMVTTRIDIHYRSCSNCGKKIPSG